MSRVLFFGTCLLCLNGLASPDWAKKDTLRREGNHLTVVCSGQGPSLDIARKEALNNCRETVVENTYSDVNVQNLTIQTERETAYHSEISSNMNVRNLDCQLDREESEEKDGSFLDYVKCRYNLSKVKFTPIGESRKEASGFVTGDDRQLIVTSIPPCSDVLVRGKRPRAIKCDENPKALILYPGDKELVVRAVGFLPKRIVLNSGQMANSIQTLEVILERD